MKHQALYYTKTEHHAVRCDLCPAGCVLKPEQRGICRNRFNDTGMLYTDNFGETVTLAIDPIEKKPLYHFRPGTDIVSIGVNGCNLACSYCQNWQISQEQSPTRYIVPEALPELGAQNDSVGIAYTYTEPVIWYEYILEAAPLVREAGLVNVMVSNGYINSKPLEELLPFIDAFNIDIKSIRPDFYTKVCKGKLQPVLDVIKQIALSPSHLELTNLIITDLNDTDNDFHQLGEFIASVDINIPLHISAYYPCYRLQNPPTTDKVLNHAYEILKSYLSHVFIGNREIPGRSHSYCPQCGEILIERHGYRVALVGVDTTGKCLACGSDSGIVLT